ncbi:putative Dol-P-Man:Man(7)GlcNAc(2)-PP-Dol alpha-1,6-mannosyltransferase [Yarrowia sp. C11]|nr:putative Dol-P-Man:Man(7)GlcNAc(2)-PP-Dol alpha-1,6-mannosyltransferase [Yarrowia sp. E02]KAG5373472.1 putative Dol-P-Man:Man(7)GlcNAc(2)-PP-Dol alpha-1,6-mannosyltransferase [Yarrowia sp. C11]
MKLDHFDYMVIVMVGFYLTLAPFTKVEESFNMQAIHDFVYFGPSDLSKYDHVDFPGVVPRTFVGAGILGLIARVLKEVVFKSAMKFDIQLMTRGALAIINAVAFMFLRHSIADFFTLSRYPNLGDIISSFYAAFQFSQFHIMYYASRTLPNMIALPLVTFSLSKAVAGEFESTITLLAVAGTIFRVEILLLAGIFSFLCLVQRRVYFSKIMIAGLKGVVIGSAISVGVDSYFWQNGTPSFNPLEQFKLVFPELQGFIFNVVEGNSSDWGVSPYSQYFLVDLPKLILNPVVLLLIPYGFVKDPSGKRGHLRLLGLTAILYVAIYSLQPHKEWRFIIYTVPIFTLLAAVGATSIWEKRNTNKIYMLGSVLIILTTFFTFVLSCFMGSISSFNYPGGFALEAFHDLPEVAKHTFHFGERGQAYVDPIMVHIDVPACMSGAIRFGESEDFTGTGAIIYDKTEDKDTLEDLWDEFDYVITAEDRPDMELADTITALTRVDAKEAIRTFTAAAKDPAGSAAEFVRVLQLAFGEDVNNAYLELEKVWNRIVVTEPALFIYKKKGVEA